MIDKKTRKCRVFYIESLELTVSNAQRALKAAQHDYLLFLGFTHRRGVFVDDYTYQDRTCHGINNALEYADEHI